MGKSWLPFGGGAAKRDLCAVVAASPPLSYRHALEGKGDHSDGEWRSYRRYWQGKKEVEIRNDTNTLGNYFGVPLRNVYKGRSSLFNVFCRFFVLFFLLYVFFCRFVR